MEGEVNETKSCCPQKATVKIVGIVSLAVVLLAAVLSDTIYEKVAGEGDEVTVVGRGKVTYQPDVARATLGVRVDNAPTAEVALRQLNEKATRVIASITALGVPLENIQTQNYSLYPQYAYPEGGAATVSGYNASEQVTVKIEKVNEENAGMVSKVIEEAGKAGTNEIQGVTFEVGDVEKLKQDAREEAIKDARKKSKNIGKASGLRLGDITGWYETIIQSPDNPNTPMYSMGMGGAESAKGGVGTPQIPSGTGEIIIDMSVDFEVE